MEAIDHVVIAVPSLALANEWFREAGFRVTPGGRHDALPTENALVAFADGSYLELLTARDPADRAEWQALAAGPYWERHLRGVSAVARRFLPSLAGPDGVVDVCLHGVRLAARGADLRRVGERAAGPVRMSRERPDGERLEWDLLLPESRWLPFWIADRTPRERRVPGGPDPTSHPNGVTGIAGFTVCCPSAPLVALSIGDLFGGVPEARSDESARLRTSTFELAVAEGAPARVCAASLLGCDTLPETLRDLGLRPGGP